MSQLNRTEIARLGGTTAARNRRLANGNTDAIISTLSTYISDLKAVADKRQQEVEALRTRLAEIKRSVGQALNGGVKVQSIDSVSGLWTSLTSLKDVKPKLRLVECAHCHRHKPRAFFNKSTDKKNGLQSWCRLCVRQYQVAKRRANGR